MEKLLRKALRGDIALPIVRIERSQKAQRGVHLVDLAAYIDKRRDAAIKECRQLTGQTSVRPAYYKPAIAIAKLVDLQGFDLSRPHHQAN